MRKSLSRRAAGCGSVLCCVLAVALSVLPAAAHAETCPNEALRTGPSAGLPDCRAYEQVSPPFKEGALPELIPSFITGLGKALEGISPDGARVDITSIGDFGDAASNNFFATYQLTRTPSGWIEHTLDLPASQFPAEHPEAATPDLLETMWEARATSQPLSAHDLLVGPVEGPLRSFGPFLPPSSTTDPPGLGFGTVTTGGAGGGSFMGASEDLSHVLYLVNSERHATDGAELHGLWPGDKTIDGEGGTQGIESLYEYTAGESGPPALVAVDNEGHQLGECGVGDGYNHEGAEISADGSRVFFAVKPGGCKGINPETGGRIEGSGPLVAEVYARSDESETVTISEPSTADCSACDTSPGVLAEAELDGSSADGSKVFFTTSQPLLGADSSANIYEYDFENPPGQKIVQVSAGAWSAGGAQVESVAGISQDGSHVYFLAKGALSGAANGRGQSPAVGESNLYVFERDAQFPGGRLSFIATVSSEETKSDLHPATLTPDGQFLAFESAVDLTPDDTSTAKQVFRYDAQTGELVRVSIGQDGFNQNGNTDTFNAEIRSGGRGELAMSNDGEYIVFQSADGLTPKALNGHLGEVEYIEEGERIKVKFYARNVYEYHDGNVYLISDGQDDSEQEGGSTVRVDGVDASGNDIFFETADQLVPQDNDTQVDVYDARIDGGFPAPVSLLPSCSGDACQGPLSASPVLLSPGSEFQAGGNPPLAAPATAAKPTSKPVQCKKGLVKEKGNCVKGKAKSKKKAKKSDRRRGR